MRFIDLSEQYRRYKQEIRSEIDAVLDSAQFIMGPQLEAFEAELAEHAQVANVVGCASGTDALLMVLMALEVGPGDEVVVPDFTFIAPAEMVAVLRATPVLCDIDARSFCVAPEQVARALTEKTKAIIGVSLFGQCCELPALESIAQQAGLPLIEDAAQSYGASIGSRRSGSFGYSGTTSFFPAKPLGAYGDGGAILTDDDDLAMELRSILNHGQSGRYEHPRLGVAGRLDALQAAVLRVKLRHFDAECVARQEVANWYEEYLPAAVELPRLSPGHTSVWAQYTIRVANRGEIAARLGELGVPTAVHYPKPLHRQGALALASRDHDDDAFPEATRAAREVLSLPMHPFLEREQVRGICDAVSKAVELIGVSP